MSISPARSQLGLSGKAVWDSYLGILGDTAKKFGIPVYLLESPSLSDLEAQLATHEINIPAEKKSAVQAFNALVQHVQQGIKEFDFNINSPERYSRGKEPEWIEAVQERLNVFDETVQGLNLDQKTSGEIRVSALRQVLENAKSACETYQGGNVSHERKTVRASAEISLAP